MGLFDKMAKRMVTQAMEVAEALTGAVGDAQDITDGVDAVGIVAEVPVIDDVATTYIQPVAMVVEIPGREPYPARPTTAFPRTKIPHKGQRLPLRVSMSDPMRIAVLWDQVKSGLDETLAQAQAGRDAGAPHVADLIGELERLDALRESGTLSDAEFAALKARLLGRDPETPR